MGEEMRPCYMVAIEEFIFDPTDVSYAMKDESDGMPSIKIGFKTSGSYIDLAFGSKDERDRHFASLMELYGFRARTKNA